MQKIEMLFAIVCIGILIPSCTTGKATTFSLDKMNEASIVLLQTDAITRGGKTNQTTVYRYFVRHLTYDKTSDTIYFEGLVTGEYVIIQIVGSLARVDLIAMEWDGYQLLEKGARSSFVDLKDRIMILNTYFSESSPNEKLRIIDINGKVYEIEIRETDLR